MLLMGPTSLCIIALLCWMHEPHWCHLPAPTGTGWGGRKVDLPHYAPLCTHQNYIISLCQLALDVEAAWRGGIYRGPPLSDDVSGLWQWLAFCWTSGIISHEANINGRWFFTFSFLLVLVMMHLVSGQIWWALHLWVSLIWMTNLMKGWEF